MYFSNGYFCTSSKLCESLLHGQNLHFFWENNLLFLYFHQNVRCTFCTLVFNLKFLLSTDFSQGQIWCMLWCMPWGPTWLYGNLSFADTETIQRSRPAQRAAFTCSWRDGLTAWRELSQRRRPQLPKSKSSTEDQSRSLQQGWVTPAGEVQVALCTVQPTPRLLLCWK